ncbi:DUF805 domain-containing protein [Flavobacteriaceae bacterium S356]|uniref:DUF805 domain-containing protein n=1 Tax=Asprobacillus argus TaxID=3076534 RepID=A0ABU3LBZ4_9FLAO|nr:DUF805 domain-containing protein [Flavobacteriaceae bacterium S356]
MFKDIFSFKGRIRRLEYGLTYLFLAILSTIIDGILEYYNYHWAFSLYNIPVFWVSIAQGAKRCHDRGNSGWYQLIPFYVFWMLFANSDYGPNDYGPNPKGEGNDVNEISEIGKE